MRGEGKTEQRSGATDCAAQRGLARCGRRFRQEVDCAGQCKTLHKVQTRDG